MTLRDIGMLVSSSNRTKLYLHVLAKHGLLPAYVIYMEDPAVVTVEQEAARRLPGEKLGAEFDPSLGVSEALEHLGVSYERVSTLDPNSDLVIEAVDARPESIFVFSAEGILGKKLLSVGKKFLHIHSGILPEYRGSTTVYYSLLKEDICGATAFIIDEQIDTGGIVKKRVFPPPADRTTIDVYYDPLMRAELLADVLREFREDGEVPVAPQDTATGETYFIIHPVLKHIAILSRPQ